ncbi:MAG: hypothetical protein MJ133_01605 [Lachnospiraceae bacterium]|nr:hypothetical protein [Lachnospiraceae bacterium]
MKNIIKNIFSTGLLLTILFVISLSSYINSYSFDTMPIGPTVNVSVEKDIPVTEITVTVERYENNKWVKLCDLSPNENGEAVFELQKETDLGAFYRLSLSTTLEAAVYAFVSTNKEISYSKQFIESTCSLGDGANFKIRTIRISQQ